MTGWKGVFSERPSRAERRTFLETMKFFLTIALSVTLIWPAHAKFHMNGNNLYDLCLRSADRCEGYIQGIVEAAQLYEKSKALCIPDAASDRC